MPSTHTIAALLAISLTALLPACTASRQAESATQAVQHEGKTYKVEQLTASTWTVGAPTPNSAETTASLVKVIEKASSCKVTDSSYVRQGTVFNAQVDCGSKLKN